MYSFTVNQMDTLSKKMTILKSINLYTVTPNENLLLTTFYRMPDKPPNLNSLKIKRKSAKSLVIGAFGYTLFSHTGA